MCTFDGFGDIERMLILLRSMIMKILIGVSISMNIHQQQSNNKLKQSRQVKEGSGMQRKGNREVQVLVPPPVPVAVLGVVPARVPVVVPAVFLEAVPVTVTVVVPALVSIPMPDLRTQTTTKMTTGETCQENTGLVHPAKDAKRNAP
jgi:hypothetical protein